MIYFTSDWHIGHNKPFIYEARGFSSIEEHDSEILKRCNELVDYNDRLFILGDLALGEDEKEWNRIFFSLKCQNIFFCIGNHETNKKMNLYEYNYAFNFIGVADILKVKNKVFYVSHYPTIVDNYNEENKFFWNLSGHTHSKEKFHPEYKIYNVSVDAHDCYPVSLEDIVEDIKNKKQEIRRKNKI